MHSDAFIYRALLSWNQSACLEKFASLTIYFMSNAYNWAVSLILKSLQLLFHFKIWSQQWKGWWVILSWLLSEKQLTLFGSDTKEVKDKFLYQARDTPTLPHWCCFVLVWLLEQHTFHESKQRTSLCFTTSVTLSF